MDEKIEFSTFLHGVGGLKHKLQQERKNSKSPGKGLVQNGIQSQNGPKGVFFPSEPYLSVSGAEMEIYTFTDN